MYAKQAIKIVIMGFVLLCVMCLWGYVESLRVRVIDVDIDNPALSLILKGKTAIQLSDIHMDSWGYRENRMMSLIETLKPDLIFLTGDVIPWRGDVHAALDFLSRLSPPMGTYAVMGDYDYSNSRNSCLFCHQKGSGLPTTAHKVRMLRNETVRIDTDEGSFWITGLDGSYESGLRPGDLHNTERENPLLVLSHDPLVFDALDQQLGCVMLSGDTHGGQLYLPQALWHLIGYEKNARYNHGVYHRGANTLYVTRGVGTSHVPFRLFCPPEIVVIRFTDKGGE